MARGQGRHCPVMTGNARKGGSPGNLGERVRSRDGHWSLGSPPLSPGPLIHSRAVLCLSRARQSSPRSRPNKKQSSLQTQFCPVTRKRLWSPLSTGKRPHGNLTTDCAHARAGSTSAAHVPLSITRYDVNTLRAHTDASHTLCTVTVYTHVSFRVSRPCATRGVGSNLVFRQKYVVS